MSELNRNVSSTIENGIQQRFEILREKTCCLYADSAVAVFAPGWNPVLSAKENVLQILPRFNEFVSKGEKGNLDMFVIEIQDKNYIHNITSFTSLFHRIIFLLRENDPTNNNPLTDGIMTLEWNFVYKGVKFFIPTFAPFYKTNHTRYSHLEESAFIILQPDHSFDRRGINSRNPGRHRITEKTKAKCEKLGYKYDVSLVSRTPKAVRYIHPITLGQSFIEWWDEAYSGVE